MNDGTATLLRSAEPLAGERLVGAVADAAAGADVVLIGEASHGTHEFYDVRAAVTRALIERSGFNVIAVEADWPDAYRANRYVRRASADPDARAALDDFTRFPRWMWRNHVVVGFLEWLRRWNEGADERLRAGFYGLDLYSLHRSAAHVLEYLAKVDPAALTRARDRYACFDVFGEDLQAYGYATSLRLEPSCEQDVVAQLVELQRRAGEYALRDGRIAADEYFVAEQNARLVRDAEEYYRAMFDDGVTSWNLRDRHMMATLESLMTHISRTQGSARAVVWAHNSHLGDARATAMARRGELNLGQLVRQRYGAACRSIGFTTHDGAVTAASDWDEPAAHMQVQPSLPGSWERLFHETGLPSFLLRLDDPSLRAGLGRPRLERAIGVIYRPDTERASHYFTAALPEQFDAVIHIDRTRALEPLETWSRHESDLPDTYPSGV